MNRSVKKVRTLQERLKIIEEVEKNPSEKRVNVAKRLGIAASTLNSIYRKKNEIREQIRRCGKSSITRKTSKESKFSELEKILFTWYQQSRAANIPIDGSIIREKAKQIAERLGINDFAASNGWITRFKDRHGLVYKKLAGESASVDPVRTSSWINELPKLLEGYEPRDIYNADETGLFYNCLPNGTLTLKGQSCHGGKGSKERISVLFCVNSDGTDLREPLVIGKSLKPRCFKNTKTLPVKYYANNKAWMTTNIFNLFLRDLDAEMRKKQRKILLFIDNCAAHPNDTAFLKNVKVMFYPANCTSVLQPLDMGIIKCFKGFYRKQLVRKAVCLMDSGIKIDKTSLKIDVLQAMHFTLTAWRQVKQSTVINCFKKCGYGSLPVPSNNEEEEVGVTEDDWNRLEIAPDINFDMFIAFDNDVATCGLETIENLCDARLKETTEEVEDDVEEDPLPVPSFSEACMAFEKFKTFLYSHTITDTEKNAICNTEKILFTYGDKTAKKQMMIKDYFN